MSLKVVKASINGKETPFQKDDYYSACKMLSIHLGLSEKDEEKLLKRGYIDYGENYAQVKIHEVNAKEWLGNKSKLTAREYATHRAIINGKEHLFNLNAHLHNNEAAWGKVVPNENGKGFTVFGLTERDKDFQYYPLEKL